MYYRAQFLWSHSTIAFRMKRKKSKPIQYLHLLLFDHIASDPSSSMRLHPHLGGLKGLDKARAVEEKLQKYLKDLQQQEKNRI